MGQAFSATTVIPLSEKRRHSSTASSLQQGLPLHQDSHGIRKHRIANKARIHTISLSHRDKSIAERVKKAIVEESVQVFWPEINAWVDCKVIEYANFLPEQATADMHCVEYADGMKEWRMLGEFRIVSENPATGKKPSQRILSSKSDQKEKHRQKEDESDARSVNTPTGK